MGRAAQRTAASATSAGGGRTCAHPRACTRQERGPSAVRNVAAPPERLFEAWTRPELLLEWWGPDGVEAINAEVDLRAGGAWRIANKMADGSVLWIGGVFESITPPHELVYS